ncbi:MAG TPA: NAD(P)-binding domain-containing protein [Kofleriaceae bacterium]
MSSRADTVGIIGAGPFGTALASVLARAGRRVVLFSRDADVVAAITAQRKNPRFPEAALPEPLTATSDLKQLASEARFLVLAVVSGNARDRARELGDVVDGSHIVVHAIGALSPHGDQRVSEVMADGLPTQKLGALAGPAMPGDLAAGHYASMVVASMFDEVVAEGRRLLNAPPMLRVYSSKDLVGVELASALAGAYTVALGMSDGLGIGAGPRAVLITRAVAEASRLGQAAGADARTFSGLSGLGNLLVRATDVERSADYALGRRLAEGVISADGARTEGARAAAAGVAMAARLRVRMPVLQGLAGVLAGKLEPREAAILVGDTVAEAE